MLLLRQRRRFVVGIFVPWAPIEEVIISAAVPFGGLVSWSFDLGEIKISRGV